MQRAPHLPRARNPEGSSRLRVVPRGSRVAAQDATVQASRFRWHAQPIIRDRALQQPSSPAGQQPKLASPRQTTERPNVCAGRRRSCGPVDAAQQHVGRWRCCCVAAKCGSPAYHAPLRSMGALKEGQSWTKACIGSVLNFPWSGAEGICLALRTKLGLAAPIRLPTPLATCKLILPFIAPPTRACICLALAP